MITTGLEQQLQRARESEHHSREAREAAAVHESKKEHHVQHAKNHDLHLNIREHIDSYLQVWPSAILTPICILHVSFFHFLYLSTDSSGQALSKENERWKGM